MTKTEQDLYSDGPDAMTRQAMESNTTKPDETPPGNEDEPTALVPKSSLAGYDAKPGDKVSFRVVRVMDDQVELVCDSSEEGEEKAEKPEAEAPAEPASPMGAYME